jgi:NhaA family Na+:H+ antiporter
VTESRTYRPPSALRSLLSSEAGSGLVLMAAAVLALIVANSPLSGAYFGTLGAHLGPLSILHWINDGLMALFFLLVGLEIKREFLDGQLSSWPRRILPGIAAAGGMIVPALIYIAINAGEAANLRGWAIPTATDIAFALGVVMLLGPRVPVSLKVFLTALAIIDDLGAVTIIAVLYTDELSGLWLGLTAATLLALWALNRAHVTRLAPYVLLGVLLWFFVLKSGVHASLAGVALALTIPLRPSPGKPDDAESLLHRLEHGLQPWVGYLVVPIFGFANAGVRLVGMDAAAAFADIPLGIAAGLFIGKQVGVFASSWLAIRTGIADCPRDASLAQLYGVSVLCGIGFTMSLFIGLLAFPGSPHLQDGVKLGVLAGSLCSALLGAAVIRLCTSAPLRKGQVAAPEAQG